MNKEAVRKICTTFRNENSYPVPQKNFINFVRTVFHLEARLKSKELKPSEMQPLLQRALDNYIKELWSVFEVVAGAGAQNANLLPSIQLLKKTIQAVELEANRREIPAETKESQNFRNFYESTPQGREKQEINLRQNYEEEMLDLAARMKSFALSYSDQLKADKELLGELSKSQDANIANVQSKNKDMDDFLKTSKSLGLFRLLMMAGISLLLFTFTTIIIVVDYKLFG